ncbi:hypothetical protein LTR01_009160 [Friedmanniomyces endolithicus]|nr:hypothetical protein LTR01_009160 [Friedmanniomyces endolithicus]
MWNDLVTDFVPESDVYLWKHVADSPHCRDSSAGTAPLDSPIVFDRPQQQAPGYIRETPLLRHDTLAEMPPTESAVICPVIFDGHRQRTSGRFWQPLPRFHDSFGSAAEVALTEAPTIVPDSFYRHEQEVPSNKRSTEVCIPAGQYQELIALLRRNRTRTSPSRASDINFQHQPGPLLNSQISPLRLSRGPGYTLADTSATAMEGMQLPIILDGSKELFKLTIDAGQTSANAVKKFIDQFGLDMDFYPPLRAICDACISGTSRPVWQVRLDDSCDSLSEYKQADLTNSTTCLASPDTRERTLLMERLQSTQFRFCTTSRSFVADVRPVPPEPQKGHEGRMTSLARSTFDSSALTHVTLHHILPSVADHIGQDMMTAMVGGSILTAARMVHPHPRTCTCEREAINANEPLQIDLHRQLLENEPAQGSTSMDQLRGRTRRLFDWLQEALVATHPNAGVWLRDQKLDPTLESAIHCINSVLQKASSVVEDRDKWVPEWIWTNIFATCFVPPKDASMVEDFGSQEGTMSTHTLSSRATLDNDTITGTGSSVRSPHAVDEIIVP